MIWQLRQNSDRDVYQPDSPVMAAPISTNAAINATPRDRNQRKFCQKFTSPSASQGSEPGGGGGGSVGSLAGGPWTGRFSSITSFPQISQEAQCQEDQSHQNHQQAAHDLQPQPPAGRRDGLHLLQLALPPQPFQVFGPRPPQMLFARRLR